MARRTHAGAATAELYPLPGELASGNPRPHTCPSPRNTPRLKEGLHHTGTSGMVWSHQPKSARWCGNKADAPRVCLCASQVSTLTTLYGLTLGALHDMPQPAHASVGGRRMGVSSLPHYVSQERTGLATGGRRGS